MYQIFSYFANNAIVVNQIVAFVKYIIEELGRIVVTKRKLTGHQSLQVSVQGQHKKEIDVKRKQPIQMAVAIYTKLYKIF